VPGGLVPSCLNCVPSLAGCPRAISIPGLPTPGLPTPGLPTPGLPTPGLPMPGLPMPGPPLKESHHVHRTRVVRRYRIPTSAGSRQLSKQACPVHAVSTQPWLAVPAPLELSLLGEGNYPPAASKPAAPSPSSRERRPVVDQDGLTGAA